MKFRVTIEQFYHPPHPEDCPECGGEAYWREIHQKEIEIGIAERASRMIERILDDEGLDINRNDLRAILFKELHEEKE